jgi:hypothetical protein
MVKRSLLIFQPELGWSSERFLLPTRRSPINITIATFLFVTKSTQ